MSKQEPKATLLSTSKIVAQRVLDQRHRGMRLHDIVVLEHAIAMDAADYLVVEFQRAGTNIVVCLRMEQQERSVFPSGNEWGEYRFHIDMSWPSLGSGDPLTALVRLNFYQEIAHWAGEMAAEFNVSYWAIERTAARIQQEKENEEARRLQGRLNDIVDHFRIGMRVGQERPLSAVAIGDLPTGQYAVTLKSQLNDEVAKKYSVIVTAGVGATLTRVE